MIVRSLAIVSSTAYRMGVQAAFAGMVLTACSVRDHYSYPPDASDAAPEADGDTDGATPACLMLAWSRGQEILVGDLEGNEQNVSNNNNNESDPIWSPIDDRVAYVRAEGGEQVIYTVRADGAGELRITPIGHYVEHAAWSADATMFAYARRVGADTEIWVVDSDGSMSTSKVSMLTGVEDTTPSISPDGARIAFFSRRSNVWDLYAVDLDGSNEQNLTDAGVASIRVEPPRWSPNGMRIVFTWPGPFGTDDIFAIDPSGMNMQNLTASDSMAESSPRWFADGLRILFIRESDIFSMDPDGTNQQPVVENPGTDVHPSIGPGGRIAWTSARDGNEEIYTASEGGSSPTRLTNNPAADRRATWRTCP